MAESKYTAGFTEAWLPDEAAESFDLEVSDERLLNMLVKNVQSNVDYWNAAPWKLRETDVENVKYYLGEQTDEKKSTNKNPDNRLFSGIRAILSYAFGQLAVPEITPSRSDKQYLKMARSIQMALYQHASENNVDVKMRSAGANLVIRKRGYLKLRYDPNMGMYGDIVTEVCNPEDIIIDRHAKFMQNPNVIYHRLHMTVEEMCNKWPDKAQDIKDAFSIRQERFTQMNRLAHPYEAWFSYTDSKGKPCEGVAWFLHDPAQIILDKCQNPNWVYGGGTKKEKQTNVSFFPPKPFINLNYLNLGHSYIDETCLFEQARPQQELLNLRLKQFNDNIDLSNGRWVASKKAFSEQDAATFINKGAKTIALVNAEDVGKAVQVMTPNNVSASVFESVQDFRAEIDGLLGTPRIFQGANPTSKDTLGRDMLVKQQAGMLQDDLVRAVSHGYSEYYRLLLQMMRVYYTDDYWFQVKGGDGKFDFVMLNGDMIDSNVRIGVKTDSTLPLDKEQIRLNAMELAKMNRIDQLTLLEDLGVPNPEIRTERFIRSEIDPYTYMQSVEMSMDNNEAEVDIMLLVAKRTPEERDVYDENYLNYFNHFVTTNRFAKLPADAKQRLVVFLQAVSQRAQASAGLQETMLNQADIINRPPIFPLPKRTLNMRLVGNMSPEQTQNIAQNEGQMFTPVTGAESAQNPANQQGAPPSPQNPQ